MLEVFLFILVFGGFFILRAVIATIVFFYLLPEGDRCPNCDAATIRVQSKGWNLLMPKFRTSWCYECGWYGLLRNGPLTRVSTDAYLSRPSQIQK
jgi:hypothetical protein